MRPRRRSLSLRARVALVAALAATIVIAAIGFAFAVFLRVNSSEQLDRTLDSVSLTVPSESAISGFGAAPTSPLVESDPAVVSTPAAEVTDSVRATTIDGAAVRAKDVPIIGAAGTLVAVSVPEDALSRAIRDQQWQVAGAAIVAIAVAAGLGWLLAGRAVRPLQRLAAATHTVGDELPAALPDIRGAREAEELAEAIGHMLTRIGKAQSRTEAALGSARDFAAVSAHELRTPLTSMRTDLEVLATMPLSDEQRAEIVRDVLATERQIENTLSDLESLAVGELSDADDHEDLDLVELADRCVQESARRLPDVAVELSTPPSLPMRGLPSGLRLVLENAVTNAVRHGRADRVRITVADNGDRGVTIAVDDNGIGVPEHERATLFERFARGSSAHPEGSGLGLALIAQQASLHGGTAALTDSPLGGARLQLDLPVTV
ncbi:HAMP domain-containing sensor histidine kinase [Rhodococcus sp. TAF43]|uniref:sensor histidine kinase n=1 Tax=unclassified Rhodococcus (in: high G+C Gram-positive bacteria) TaxID=192944 RepID=UPI001581806B|nr:HAMP domain-containing sensor histidine kinase [Rhodococcus sp. W8901]QKT10579.1 HAMP domain-containing histidine kinase [Rhodococcus sp. W8901]